jgi:hypothetical protein
MGRRAAIASFCSQNREIELNVFGGALAGRLESAMVRARIIPLPIMEPPPPSTNSEALEEEVLEPQPFITKHGRTGECNHCGKSNLQLTRGAFGDRSKNLAGLKWCEE